jgi:hypothetical protein
MWPTTFERRLESWTQLRNRALSADLETALTDIDTWWKGSPWQPYYLHWDDRQTWPDPWQLLSDDTYCSLARALGILYTVTIIDRPDLQDACMAEIGNDNLVLAHGGKYILNWECAEELNTNPEARIRRQVTQLQLKQQYN